MSDDLFKRLSAPFPPSKVSWRVGQITKNDPSKASALCYIDARDVMDRLDAACGPARWADSYNETQRGRLICTLSIEVGGAWISKSDGAGDTAVEGEKGAISDAFKRAAVKWGIGRYLYDVPVQWVRINQFKQIERSEMAKLAAVLPGSQVHDLADDDAPAPRHSGNALEEIERHVTAAIDTINSLPSLPDLQAFWADVAPTIKRQIPAAAFARVAAAKDARKAALSKLAA